VLVAATDAGVCMVAFDDADERLVVAMRSRFAGAVFAAAGAADDPARMSRLDTWVGGVLHAIAHPRQAVDLPLDMRGSGFRKTVWQALRMIPPGDSASYGDIAARIGHAGAARAVAGACAGNPIALLVPCHRVLRRDGELGGFRWGVDRKRVLLERERA
jgi:AraC family transcriptional regulator of adaptative response/methylated-DNA-[protein]-cysteine methyltransferase